VSRFEGSSTITKLTELSLVLLVIGFVTPIVITVHDKLPLVSAVYEKAKPYIIYPSTIGSYQVRPLPWLFRKRANCRPSPMGRWIFRPEYETYIR